MPIQRMRLALRTRQSLRQYQMCVCLLLELALDALRLVPSEAGVLSHSHLMTVGA